MAMADDSGTAVQKCARTANESAFAVLCSTMSAQPQAKRATPAQTEPARYIDEERPGWVPNGSILDFGVEKREPWDYVPVPPVVLDEDGYLESDALPQTERHLRRLLAYAPVLIARYEGRGGKVGAEMSMPYVKGCPGKMLSPDLFVARKAEERKTRSCYKLWKEPVPEFVLEDLSPGNWRLDAVDKRVLYRRLGVQEYWMFDETGRQLRDDSGERLGVWLVGYRLCGGDYKRVCANAAGRLPSEALGLELCVEDGLVRFSDPATARYLPTYDESEDEVAQERARRESAEQRADAERTRRESAERRAAAAQARVEALEAQLRSHRV